MVPPAFTLDCTFMTISFKSYVGYVPLLLVPAFTFDCTFTVISFKS